MHKNLATLIMDLSNRRDKRTAQETKQVNIFSSNAIAAEYLLNSFPLPSNSRHFCENDERSQSCSDNTVSYIILISAVDCIDLFNDSTPLDPFQINTI